MIDIHPTAVIFPGVIIEDGVHVGPYCIIGAKAEYRKFWNSESLFSVIIKKGTIITGHVTIDAGTEKHTEIGNDCFIMKGVHIGHDSTIRDEVTLSPHVVIAGHCEIGARTNMGIGSIVHQHLKIPEDCMIGMNTTITKRTHLIPNWVYIGSPAEKLRKNKK